MTFRLCKSITILKVAALTTLVYMYIQSEKSSFICSFRFQTGSLHTAPPKWTLEFELPVNDLERIKPYLIFL